VPTKEPKTPCCEKRAKADGIPLKEINAPSRPEFASYFFIGLISFLTLHSVNFLTLFFLRPMEHRMQK